MSIVFRSFRKDTFTAALVGLGLTAMLPDPAEAQTFPDGYFTLTTQFRESFGECLEGNQLGAAMGGAACIDNCQNVVAPRSGPGDVLSSGHLGLPDPELS